MAAWQNIKGQTRERTYLLLFVLLLMKFVGLLPTVPAMAGGRSELSTLICNKVSKESSNRAKLHSIIHQ